MTHAHVKQLNNLLIALNVEPDFFTIQAAINDAGEKVLALSTMLLERSWRITEKSYGKGRCTIQVNDEDGQVVRMTNSVESAIGEVAKDFVRTVRV